MPNKKGKNSKSKSKQDTEIKRELLLKDDLEEYGLVTSLLGDCRLKVILTNNTEYTATIPGRFRKRCWFKVNDIVIISIREFQENKVDILHKFKDGEAVTLHKLGEIPDFFMVNKSNNYDGIVFEETDNESDPNELDFARNTDLPDSSSDEDEQFDKDFEKVISEI